MTDLPLDVRDPDLFGDPDLFRDPRLFTALPRLTSLALSPDGTRLVAVRQEPDAKGARYVSALWDIDTAGKRPAVRLTRSEKGESQPAFRPDGTLLFTSVRPGAGEDDEAVLWELPAFGEARPVACVPGGVSGPVVAADAGTVFFLGSRLPGSADTEADRAARDDRSERRLNHILHDGFPIRYWDHELGDAWPRLFTLDGDEPRELAGRRQELEEARVSVDAAGRTAVTTWRTRRPRGRVGARLALVDVATGTAREMAGSGEEYEYYSPAISPDGRYVAAVENTEGTFTEHLTYRLAVLPTAPGGDVVTIDTGDLFPTALAWSGDGRTLIVTGDLHGRGGLLAIAAGTWAVRRLAEDAAYTSLCVAPDATVYALRTTTDRPPHPVRVDPDGTLVELTGPDPAPELPGRLVELTVPAPDGQRVHAWLCLPHDAGADRPVPLQLWIHGGPFASYNAWSWRWCPWVAVARGYAVLLPDPALSTGYGHGWLARAWPHRAGLVWDDLRAVLDATEAREDIDATRTTCLGGSFGGYMTNWIAGHTDRFRAIVTHAGLWALDQQHTTTDAANWKSGLFGTPAEHPEWYAENSPHHFIANIRTPMLVVHGNRDYRVPVSEALRLWWDLVSHFDGEPDALPHRFLQFTGENHWILSPGNATTWYETVQGFVDRHSAR